VTVNELIEKLRALHGDHDLRIVYVRVVEEFFEGADDPHMAQADDVSIEGNVVIIE
jgi:hypothetical protein